MEFLVFMGCAVIYLTEYRDKVTLPVLRMRASGYITGQVFVVDGGMVM